MVLVMLPESVQITRLETENTTHGAERNVKRRQLPSQILTQVVKTGSVQVPFIQRGRGDIRGGKTSELKTKELSISICSSVKMRMKQAVVKIK